MGRRSAVAVGTDTIESLGDQTGGGGFADAADAGQNVSVVQAVVVDGVGRGLHQRFLSQQVFKILRTILAG